MNFDFDLAQEKLSQCEKVKMEVIGSWWEVFVFLSC